MDSPPPIQQATPPSSKAPAMSLPARLLNIFATPGDVFDDLKGARSCGSNWLVPMLLLFLVGAISSTLVLSQPAIVEQLRAQQAKGVENLVSSGKMTQAQGDRQIEMMEKLMTPTAMKVFGVLGAFFVAVAGIFWWALLVWLIGRFGLKAPLNFMKAAELAGLASMITSLEISMRTLLVFGFSNVLASPSLALFIKEPDPKNKMFQMLSLLNIMTFWALAVRCIGLARWAQVPFGRAAMWVFGTWAILMMLQTGVLFAAHAFIGG